MTHVTCRGCQLRFTRSAAASVTRCPFCGGALETVDAQHTVGYQLVEPVVSLSDRSETFPVIQPQPLPPTPPAP